MRPLMIVAFSSLVVLLLGSGCEKETAVASDGSEECKELGSTCHEAGEALGGEYEECHIIGHVNDGPDCLQNYSRCIALCENAHFGEGGAGGEHGHEAGAGGATH
jgi:hypothetical protein